jgi:hypothetical protein
MRFVSPSKSKCDALRQSVSRDFLSEGLLFNNDELILTEISTSGLEPLPQICPSLIVKTGTGARLIYAPACVKHNDGWPPAAYLLRHLLGPRGGDRRRNLNGDRSLIGGRDTRYYQRRHGWIQPCGWS